MAKFIKKPFDKENCFICKNMAKFSDKNIILSCFVFFFLLFLMGDFITFAAETIAFKTGKLVTQEIKVEDMEWVSMEQKGEYIVATDGDPQFILQPKTLVARIDFTVKYSVNPGEILLYYSSKEGQGFSDRKRFWARPVENFDNCYRVDMGIKRVNSLRLDPTMAAGNHMKMEKIIINSPKSFVDYFSINSGDFFDVTVFSLILASFLKLVKEFVTKK